MQCLCNPGDFWGLKAFREDYPEAKAVLSYRGKESFARDGIPALPVGDFLPALPAGAALPWCTVLNKISDMLIPLGGPGSVRDDSVELTRELSGEKLPV